MEPLHRIGSAAIESLPRLCVASRVTVHRNLRRLKRPRVVRKSCGSVRLPSSATFEAHDDHRGRPALAENRIVARFKSASLSTADHSVLMVDHIKLETAMHLVSRLSGSDDVVSANLRDHETAVDLRRKQVNLSLRLVTPSSGPLP